MHIKIHQIDASQDNSRLLFLNYAATVKRVGGVLPHIYRTVWEGEVNTNDIEDIYRIFNIELPKDYKARSMSLSDIVEKADGTCWFCDSFGFKQLKGFIKERIQPMKGAEGEVLCTQA